MSEKEAKAVTHTLVALRMYLCPHLAFICTAGRIRLVWGKLWLVISAHLVSATCHPSQPVALMAVEALRGLAARLLSRCV